MDWKSEYYQAYVVIVRWVISEKIHWLKIFLQSKNRLLCKCSKETAYCSNEEQKPYQQRRFFENFEPGCNIRRMVWVFDDDFRQSELRSCNFMIEPLDQDDCDYYGYPQKYWISIYQHWMHQYYANDKVISPQFILDFIQYQCNK